MSMSISTPAPIDYQPFIEKVAEILRNSNPGKTFHTKTIGGHGVFVEPKDVYSGVSVYTFAQSKHKPLIVTAHKGSVQIEATKDVKQFEKLAKKQFKDAHGVIDSLLPIVAEAMAVLPGAEIYLAHIEIRKPSITTVVLLKSIEVTLGDSVMSTFDLIKITHRS